MLILFKQGGFQILGSQLAPGASNVPEIMKAVLYLPHTYAASLMYSCAVAVAVAAG